jgi:ATP-GRASP peptide maturase of grasp-with-spasm system
MILIISNDAEFTTNDVIDWLRFYKIPFKRISSTNDLIVNSLTFNKSVVNFNFEIDGETFNFNNIKAVWYRRSELTIKTLKYTSGVDTEFDKQVNRQLRDEAQIIHEAIWDLFKTKSINTEFDNNINKLKVLNACSKLNIKYPKSLITTSKTELKKFIKDTGAIITKNISQGTNLQIKKTAFVPYTSKVSSKDIKNLPKEFSPMFFQEMIVKSFEIRIFYLKGMFFSSAIFSQNDSKTKVDFRNYNYKKPNRTPPFKLDPTYEGLLHKLMLTLDINSGSIDILVDEKGEYYFLEINPIGQFQQVSAPCNYYLEETVAKQLML